MGTRVPKWFKIDQSPGFLCLAKLGYQTTSPGCMDGGRQALNTQYLPFHAIVSLFPNMICSKLEEKKYSSNHFQLFRSN